MSATLLRGTPLVLAISTRVGKALSLLLRMEHWGVAALAGCTAPANRVGGIDCTSIMQSGTETTAVDSAWSGLHVLTRVSAGGTIHSVIAVFRDPALGPLQTLALFGGEVAQLTDSNLELEEVLQKIRDRHADSTRSRQQYAWWLEPDEIERLRAQLVAESPYVPLPAWLINGLDQVAAMPFGSVYIDSERLGPFQGVMPALPSKRPACSGIVLAERDLPVVNGMIGQITQWDGAEYTR